MRTRNTQQHAAPSKSPNAPTRLSIVIPAHNEEKLIAGCLKSILRNPPQELEEIIVVDNASTDHTKEIASMFPRVRVVAEPDKGLTKARQKGLEEARGELIAYLDADTRIPEGWFETIRTTFSRHKEVVCLSGPYRYYDLPPFKKFLAEAGWRIFAPITYRIVGYMVLGGNFVARKWALEKMGGFDKNIAFYGEDTNIAWRLHQYGKVLFRMDFYVMSSGRRLLHEGLLKTYVVYSLNYLWGVWFRKPLTKRYRDIR